MKYVVAMDYVYRLTDRAYLDMLKRIAAGGDSNIDRVGKCLGQVEATITDMDADEAAGRLADVGIEA